MAFDEVAVAAAIVASGEDLDGERAADLALADGCARGDAIALGIFESTYLALAPAALARMRLSSEVVDEVVQRVRVKLLVGDDGATRLRRYAGQRALGGLVRLTAVRTALNLIRSKQRERLESDEGVIDQLAATHDPERQLVAATSVATVRAAIATSVAAMSPRDRTLLRLHLIDRLGIDEIGAVYRVHRATAARWLDSLRTQLASETRRRLSEGLGLDGSQLDRELAAARSQLDASFERLLRPE